MAKGQSLQDPFLNALRKERVPVSIYLVNGIKLQGQIDSFDQFVVLLRNSVSQMVYKHAISTVVPARNVRIADGGRRRATPKSDARRVTTRAVRHGGHALFERPTQRRARAARAPSASVAPVGRRGRRGIRRSSRARPARSPSATHRRRARAARSAYLHRQRQGRGDREAARVPRRRPGAGQPSAVARPGTQPRKAASSAACSTAPA